MTTHSPQTTIALLLTGLAVGLSGCATPAPTKSTDAAQSTAAAKSQSDGTPTAGTGDQTTHESPAPSAAASAAQTDTPPVATRTATIDGVAFSLEMYPLQRRGRTLTLVARLTATSVPPGSETGSPAPLMVATQTTDPNYLVDNGFRLVDTPRGVAHLPARRGETDACSATNRSWSQGDSRWVSCVFGAPDAAADRLAVQVQSFGSFDDVPVR